MLKKELKVREYSHIQWKAYRYSPSFEAAVSFVVLFGLTTLYLIFQLLRATSSTQVNKRHRGIIWTIIPLIMGGLFETFGYGAKLISSLDYTKNKAYVAEILFFLIFLSLYTITFYMSLGLLMKRLEFRKLFFISTGNLIIIFVIGDILSCLIQLVERLIIVFRSLSIGKNINISGMIIQIIFLSFFILVALAFHYKAAKYPNEYIMIIRNVPSQFNNWNSILLVILSCSTLLLMKYIFRLIEALQGVNGYLSSYEIFLYCFDTAVMFISTALFISQNIGKYHLQFETYFCNDSSEESVVKIIHTDYFSL